MKIWDKDNYKKKKNFQYICAKIAKKIKIYRIWHLNAA